MNIGSELALPLGGSDPDPTLWTFFFCWLFEDLTKDQLISKCFLGVIGFLQKTNENKSHSRKNEFVCSFFGRIQDTIICIRDYPTFSDLKIFANSQP